MLHIDWVFHFKNIDSCCLKTLCQGWGVCVVQDGSKQLRWKLVPHQEVKATCNRLQRTRIKARLQDERWSLEGSGIWGGASHGMTDQQRERERQRTRRETQAHGCVLGQRSKGARRSAPCKDRVRPEHAGPRVPPRADFLRQAARGHCRLRERAVPRQEPRLSPWAATGHCRLREKAVPAQEA